MFIKQYLIIFIVTLLGAGIWYIKDNQKLKDQTIQLTNTLKEMDKDDEQLLETEEQENEIASRPLPSPGDVDNWMSNESGDESRPGYNR